MIEGQPAARLERTRVAVHLGSRLRRDGAKRSMGRLLDIPIRLEPAIKAAEQLQKRVELFSHIRGLDLPGVAPQGKARIGIERRHSKQGFGEARPAPQHRSGYA